jgi:hypothetical protein
VKNESFVGRSMQIVALKRLLWLGRFGGVGHSCTSRSGCGYGSERSRMAFTRLNTSVLAPMPSASERTMMKVVPGWRDTTRIA